MIQKDDVIERLLLVLSGAHLPHFGVRCMRHGYSWKIPPRPSFAGDCEWPEGSDYPANVRLKTVLHQLWGRQEVDRFELSKWVVSDWGGVRGNRPETIFKYIDFAESSKVPPGLSGVASYSKILSIVQPERFAIYDARVAVAINAAQMMFGSPGMAFPYIPGRNKITGNSLSRQGFSQISDFSTAALVRRGWQEVSKANAYEIYLNLLQELRERFSKSVKIFDMEMTFFSQAEKLVLEVAPNLIEVGARKEDEMRKR